MSITTIFIYLIYSFILFLILDFLNYKKIDKGNNIVITLIYLIIISSISPNRTDNIFLIPILELVLRIIINIYIFERNFLKEHRREIKIYFFSIICGYILNVSFINKVDNVMPSAEQLRVIIWLLIAFYLIKLIKNDLEITLKMDTQKEDIFNEEYIVIEYAKLKNKYSNSINTKVKSLIPVIYAIMIYESYYKSTFMRKLDELSFKFNNKEQKFGIMQIPSDKILDDESSIHIAVEQLEKITTNIKNKKNSKKENTKLILKEYINNEPKFKEIVKIYDTIIAFDRK